MNSVIEDIASQHLGRTSDGGTMTRYETPDEVDSSLLVGIPRVLNRTAYNIEASDFEGFDVWNAYEVSFLLDNGYPVSGVMKYVYPCNTDNIVESKSIKLYLNSFNMAKMGDNLDVAVQRATEIMEADLTSCIGGPVYANFTRNVAISGVAVEEQYTTVEDVVDVSSITFDRYNEDPDILELEQIAGADLIETFYHTNALRSNCRVTNQPDWGDIYVYVNGSHTITPESFLQYIVSMRKENHFHEEICECVFKRLSVLMPDARVAVACLYTRRGGIDINPVRATDDATIMDAGFHMMSMVEIPHAKTERQ